VTYGLRFIYQETPAIPAAVKPAARVDVLSDADIYRFPLVGGGRVSVVYPKRREILPEVLIEGDPDHLLVPALKIIVWALMGRPDRVDLIENSETVKTWSGRDRVYDLALELFGHFLLLIDSDPAYQGKGGGKLKW
jgi:hypothetical protein